MKTVILAALTALPLLSQAQQTTDFLPFPDNGVYTTAADFVNRTVTDGFDTGQRGYHLHDELFRHAVKINQPSDKAVEIPTASLWGERINDVDYRLVDGETYRVEHADRIFVYTKPNAVNPSPQRVYYFSREANSPIYEITTQNLTNIYYDQPDKKARFTDVDNWGSNPARQAVRLTQLFYTNGATVPTGASAE